MLSVEISCEKINGRDCEIVRLEENSTTGFSTRIILLFTPATIT